MNLRELLEALTPSQYRDLYKYWNPKAYEKLFHNFNGQKDKKAFRLYLPLETPPTQQEKDPVEKEVATYLAQLPKTGYVITDYAGGYAVSNDGGNPIKIGKLLSNNPDLLQRYSKSKQGTIKQSNLLVCISRHPYDISGMSTNRGWTSCMNMGSDDPDNKSDRKSTRLNSSH